MEAMLRTSYEGHYVVLSRYDSDTQEFVYSDPNTSQRTQQTNIYPLFAVRFAPHNAHDACARWCLRLLLLECGGL